MPEVHPNSPNAERQPPVKAAALPKIICKFQNIESPGAPLSWAWQGQLYTYADGGLYQMDQEQIDHLNSLQVMHFQQEYSPEGQLMSKVAGSRNRFAVRPATRQEIADAQAQL